MCRGGRCLVFISSEARLSAGFASYFDPPRLSFPPQGGVNCRVPFDKFELVSFFPLNHEMSSPVLFCGDDDIPDVATID